MFARAQARADTGFEIAPSCERFCSKARSPMARLFESSDRGRAVKAIGSSEQVHVVDALAITGDEGRGSLRKASGSWQTSFDPRMSEWGNPTRKGYLNPNP